MQQLNKPQVPKQPRFLSTLQKSNLPNVQPRIKLSDLQLRTAEIFQDKTVIGEGTFGKVYKATIRNDADK